MRYVVLTTSNDGNSGAVCENLEAAKATTRQMLMSFDGTDECPMKDDEIKTMDQELAEVTETYQPCIPGGSRWKECAYIAPIEDE